jgi:nucleoside-diphosphate-sugar epimerase
MQMPAEAYQANTIDTIVLLNALSGRGIKLIYVATDKVYGDQEQCTLDTVFKPLNAYDVSKVAAEVVVGEWAGRNPCVLARFPNFFGPGDPHLERLIPGVVRAIEMKQEKFVVRTIPDASRQYIFIEDAVGIIQNLIYSAQHSAQGRHHFGSPIVKTVRQVIGDLCDLFDHKMQLLIDNLQGEASKLSLAHCSSLPQLYTSWESSLDSFLERR